jgi:hypothetical protein
MLQQFLKLKFILNIFILRILFGMMVFMKRTLEKGWLRPGMRSSDYGLHFQHDHDYRRYSGVNFFGCGPKGPYKSDQLLREEVCELLKWDPEVDATAIEVFVNHGIVILKGSVDSRHAKRRAEYLLDHLRGVVEVKNKILIRPLLDIKSEKIVTRGDHGLLSQEISPR